MALEPGSKLGRYEIRSPIGAGGMGEVYEARDARLERNVAVKVLKQEVAGDPKRLLRFEREARATAALSHPNIATVFDVGSDHGASYVVSELLEGETLRHRLAAEPPTLRKGVEIGAAIAAGLAAAHSRGVVHRDLKPANVFLSRDGVVKILDFGLAKLLGSTAGADDAAEATATTQEGAVLGTVAYMSPEQARGLPVDHRSDLFSLGVVLFEMLAGEHPFRGGNAAETLASILNEDPSPLLEQRVPAALARVVRLCLEKRPEDRFQSAHDLGLALGALLEAAPTGLPGATPTRRSVAGGLAAVALLGVVAVGVARYRRAPTAPPAVGEVVRVTHDGQGKSVDPSNHYQTSLLTDGPRVYFSEPARGNAPLSALVAGGGAESVSGQLPLDRPITLVSDISPDGAELLVEGYEVGGPERPLWVWPLAGGAPRRLGGIVGHSPAYAPDGESIAYGSGQEILLTTRSGAPSTPLAQLDGRPFALRWSPDGTRLRFSLAQGGRYSLWELSLSGAPPRPVLTSWRNPPLECCGTWTADGRYYVFEGHHESRVDLWAVDGDLDSASEPVRLTAGPLSYRLPAPSADGTRLFAIGIYQRGELLRYDLEAERLEPMLGGLSAEMLDFSPDGEWVAYVTYPQQELWRCRIDGSERLQLSPPLLRAALPRWAPDGRRIAVAAAARGEAWRSYVVPSDGGGLEPLLPAGTASTDVTWAPDGTRIAFGQGGQGQRRRSVGLYDITTGDLTEITGPSDAAIYAPRWSPDGRSLSVESVNSNALMLYDLETETWSRLLEGPVGWHVWTRDGRRLCFYDHTGREPACLSVEDGKLERLPAISVGRARGVFGTWAGFTPDGEPLLLRDHGTQDVYAFEWHAPEP